MKRPKRTIAELQRLLGYEPSENDLRLDAQELERAHAEAIREDIDRGAPVDWPLVVEVKHERV